MYDDTDKLLREVRDRTRRIETRMTKFLESQGFDTQTQKPVFYPMGVLDVPSPSISLKDILEAIPAGYLKVNDVVIQHKGVVLAALTLS